LILCIFLLFLDLFSQGEWLQVDLGQRTAVTGVATQGKIVYGEKYVTKYKISSSLDESSWLVYKENGTAKVSLAMCFIEGTVSSNLKGNFDELRT